MAPPGRKPIDPLLKARRAAAIAIQKRNALSDQLKTEVTNPPGLRARKIGKQPVSLPEKLRRQQISANEALIALQELEEKAGNKPMTENSLLKWLSESDYASGVGQPSLGELGYLFKELRRKSHKLSEVMDTPAAIYNERYNNWLVAEGKKGRQPQTRAQRLSELKIQIRDIEDQINQKRMHLSEGENLKIELDQLRIKRRNLSFRINNHLGILSTDQNATHQQYEYLKSSKGRRFRKAAADLDQHIDEVTKQIKERFPAFLKSRPTSRELKRQKDALQTAVALLYENAAPAAKKQALKKLQLQGFDTSELLSKDSSQIIK